MWSVLNIIAAYIGCVTGIVSLFISLKKYTYTRGKLIVKQSKEVGRGSFYFNPKSHNMLPNYNTSCSASFCLAVTNKSCNPVSINFIGLKRPEINLFRLDSPGPSQIIYKDTENHSMHFTLQKNDSLPLQMAPFETKYIGTFFPFFDACITTFGDDVELLLHVETSKKTKVVKVVLKEFDAYVALKLQTNNQI